MNNMPKLYKSILVALFTFILAYSGPKLYRYWQSSPDTAISSIPPKENSAGFIDYTLVAEQVRSNPDEIYKPRKFHREEWVLRFPKDIWINVHEQREDIGQFIIDGISLRTKAIPNRAFSFYLNMPEMAFMTQEEFKVSTNWVHVIVSSTHNRYGTIDQSGSILSATNRRRIGFNTNFQGVPICHEDGQVLPGVFKIKDGSLDDSDKNPTSVSTKKRCSKDFISSEHFHFYDEDGKPKAFGYCAKKKNVDTDKNRRCYWRMWSQHKRIITVNFRAAHFKNTSEILNRVDSIVNEATIKIRGRG